ncbi:hypothetical protein DOTSEDRAFT_75356 [Dothistroma septosporum NZE10]|uniref:TUG ubiquitin-like domain-containing protein n=1 Tax=Dothistroma septosporum (strain NZE10 / CBS 128990) TaxID=675120 RepID=M2YL46_DOTSN|nr:hypothetical protein DOTSEDRAFT_75356 [Dothistroma septosporum NZE10]
MASQIYVVDSGIKRTTIRVTPGRYMREVLEEACKSRKLVPESYALKTQNNKAVDLSQPFRLSGLSAGAKLQLVQASKSIGVVNVALQLPESEGGGRVADKFPSTTSLWLVLRKYEDGVAGQLSRKLNLTQRAVPSNQVSGAGRLEYEQPVVNVMGRNLDTFADLQKTLGQLGFNSGSVLLRLDFKNSEQPLEEAMKEIGDHFNAPDPSTQQIASVEPIAVLPTQEQATDASDASLAAGNEDDLTMTEASQIGATSPTEAIMPTGTQAQPSSIPEQMTAPPANTLDGISVYRPPSSSTPAAAMQPDDPSIFEPSIAHAKAHQAALERAGKNTRLLSDKELEEQEDARQASIALIQQVTVRVKYPDQSMIETTCYASESGADLYAKVEETLSQAGEPFELRFLGAKGFQTVPNSTTNRLVRDLGFRGRIMVTLVWSSSASAKARQGPSLKDDYRSRAQDLKVELQTQQAAGQENHKAAMAKKDKPEPGSSSKSKLDVESKMKKFLGFGKK